MYVLDTNVVSELRKVEKGKCDPSVLAWSQTVLPADLYISVITVLEVEAGILLLERRDDDRARKMRLWLATQIIPAFTGRILNVDLPAAMICATLHVPQKRPDRDAFIAATALHHNLTVVTRNTRVFEGTGVRLLNPWDV